MGAPSLQDGIDQAGSPMGCCGGRTRSRGTRRTSSRSTRAGAPEQPRGTRACRSPTSRTTCSTRSSTGPDATSCWRRLRQQLREVRGRPGQAVRPGDRDGNIVTDGILLRTGSRPTSLSGIPAAQNWVKYHGEQGGYDVAFSTDPSSAFRGGGRPAAVPLPGAGPAGARAGGDGVRRAAAAVQVLPLGPGHAGRAGVLRAAPQHGGPGRVTSSSARGSTPRTSRTR